MRRVAVTGFGVVSAVGNGREAFWNALAEGRSGIGAITHFDASTFEVQLAAEVKAEVELPERVARVASRDPKIGFAWAACSEALAMAGRRELDGGTLLHLGASLEILDLGRLANNGSPDFREVVRQSLGDGQPPLQIPLDTAARCIEGTFGRAGRALTNCSACAAGAQAIGHGFHAVRAGEFELAVCGGFDSMVNPLGVGGFQLLGALTTDRASGARACRPFDAARSGTVLGEGAAVVVLELLEKARAEGRRILAEVLGYGSSLDAHSLSAPDPEGNGAARAMMDALRDAGLAPEAVGHINAHGTGTLLNDAVEASAIRRLFSGVWQSIAVSATKSVTGHCIAAAGAIEAGACLLPFARGVLAPNPSLERVGSGCELNHVTEAGVAFEGEYILSNSFGFGGQNAALVLGRAER